MPNKRGTQRDGLQIMHDILAVCKTPTAKTRLMFKCYLEYRQMQTYLEKMIAFGIIEARRDSDTTPAKFATTNKGLDMHATIERAYNLAGIGFRNNDERLYY